MGSSKEDIQKLFSLILGSKVNTTSKTLEIDKKDLFIFCVEQLGDCLKKEEQLEEIGVNISQITDPLWFVIENLSFAFYGSKTTDLIMWFLYERTDIDGKVQYYVDDSDKRFLFNTPEDLWGYVNYSIL
jgi:hypothetical protein|tara:strand:- start:250 stop:636 length:387 start_codon:yes stop_codon:yes gene_type:complete